MTDIELLNRVLELFKLCDSNSELLNNLLKNEFLHPSFEQRSILNQVDFEFILTDKAKKNEGLVEYYLDSPDGCPYRAEVIFDGKWYLKSFLFLCQGCFGNYEECNVCGGSGWGVL